MGIVYVATNRINGKQYVGKSVLTLYSRMRGHKRASLVEESATVFHLAIRKYGWDAFDWEVVFQRKEESILFSVEILTIAELGTKIPNGYNMTDGGAGPNGGTYQHTEEAKEKIRVANLGIRLNKTYEELYGDRAGEIREAIRNALALPENLEKRKKAIQVLLKDPAFLAKRGRCISRSLQTPESKKKRSKIFLEVMNQPAVKRQLSKKQKSNWEDPEYRTRLSESLKKANQKEEVKDRRRQAQLGKTRSDEAKSKSSNSLKARWQDPEFREAMLEARAAKKRKNNG